MYSPGDMLSNVEFSNRVAEANASRTRIGRDGFTRTVLAFSGETEEDSAVYEGWKTTETGNHICIPPEEYEDFPMRDHFPPEHHVEVTE